MKLWQRLKFKKGSTGHWPVPSGDPPDGTPVAELLLIMRCYKICSLHSGRLVADRDGRVARATQIKALPKRCRNYLRNQFTGLDSRM